MKYNILYNRFKHIFWRMYVLSCAFYTLYSKLPIIFTFCRLEDIKLSAGYLDVTVFGDGPDSEN